MVDPYVFLAAVLLLAVVALLRFVGCATILGVDDVAYAPSTSAPATTSIDPTSKTEGDPDFPLTVNGSGFVSGKSVVRWNGSDRTTTFVSDGLLRAQITAADIATHGTASVTVFTQSPGGGTSNPQTFTINAAPVTVTFDNLAPPPGNPGDPLNGVYKTLNFGTGVWFWQGPTPPAPANNIFVTPGSALPAGGQISFANPGGRVLQKMSVVAQKTGDITLTDNVNPTKSATITANASPKDVVTGWTKPSGSVTVESSVGWDILIISITYQGPP